MEERLQKLLSRSGAASRRKAEELILAGRVRVNGNTAHLGDSADAAEDVIELDGKCLRFSQPHLVLMLNKPRGYVTTLSDEKGRRTVAELVQDCGARVYPIGRLDLNSEGLLLMTNDGALANRLMHPRAGFTKTYLVWVTGYRDGVDAALREPIEIDGRATAPAQVRLVRRQEDRALLEFVICEGRNRQIRRLCERAEVRVTRLLRVAEGSLKLGQLAPGTWRKLTDEELESLIK